MKSGMWRFCIPYVEEWNGYGNNVWGVFLGENILCGFCLRCIILGKFLCYPNDIYRGVVRFKYAHPIQVYINMCFMIYGNRSAHNNNALRGHN